MPKPGEQPSDTVSRAARYIKKLLTGKMFSNGNTPNVQFTDKVSQAEIEAAIDSFHEMITNPTILSANKDSLKKFSLPDFILSQHTGQSYFVKCHLKDFSYKKELFVPKKDQVFFEALKANYDKYVRGDRVYTQLELSKLMIGADLLRKKMEMIGENITYALSYAQDIDEALISDWVFESLIQRFGGVAIGNIASTFTYDYTFPEYLVRKGRLSKAPPVKPYIDQDAADDEEFKDHPYYIKSADRKKLAKKDPMPPPTDESYLEDIQYMKESPWYLQASDI
jgi:hypothetical protein